MGLRDYIPESRVTIDLTSVDYLTGTADNVSALYCNVAGDISVKFRGDSAFTVYTVSAGQILPGYVKEIDQSACDAAFQNATALVGWVLPK